MNFTLIAANLVTLLVPFAKKAMEEFSGEAGKAVFNKISSVFSKVKSFFSHDAVASDTLARFENEPDKYKPFLEDVLKEQLAKNPDFGKEISHLLKEIENDGPQLKIVQKMQKGDNVMGVEAEEIGKAGISVDQDIAEGKNVTGVKAGKIGK
ncbi:hypothetical protein FC093_06345 [Ilyomonas limi]|uniref:Uncharacterized protein n=1 Tax=Ilyomonas limi TaxID=2575867 RepID=A0A4V5UUU3_9BACT|nr:hypothetical protein [Ilyomonas limi]TKK70363.1 hypothetical protein FC093_06345 [Ilyomonas limi]